MNPIGSVGRVLLEPEACPTLPRHIHLLLLNSPGIAGINEGVSILRRYY